jgi:hypothetical protein
MKVRAGSAGNFWVGVSISRQTTVPLLVLIGAGWWMISVTVGRPVYDIRMKRDPDA